MLNRVARAGVALAMIAGALASPAARAVLSINEPWVRAAPGGRTAQVFLNLRSSEDAALVGVDSFAAKTSTLRSAGPRRELPQIALPANVLVELKPDGVHLALDGLVRRLKTGEHVPITLIVRAADGSTQKLYVQAEVRRHSPTEDESNPHAHHSAVIGRAAHK